MNDFVRIGDTCIRRDRVCFVHMEKSRIVVCIDKDEQISFEYSTEDDARDAFELFATGNAMETWKSKMVRRYNAIRKLRRIIRGEGATKK